MESDRLKMLLIGGPTLLIEWMGLRLLLDPTFDPAGTSFQLGPITLTKTTGPATEDVGPIDAVLLSHDQHPDNLDTAGRAMLPTAGRVITTLSGASRLGGNAVGLEPWGSIDLPTAAGGRLTITAAPARHGPEGCEPICGDVVGFILNPNDGRDSVYITGDTVWFDGVAEVARRIQASTVVLFAGAARLDAVGPSHLTMTTADAVATAKAFPKATIVPVHYDGWAHFSEGRDQLTAAFDDAGLSRRVVWLEPGETRVVG